MVAVAPAGSAGEGVDDLAGVSGLESPGLEDPEVGAPGVGAPGVAAVGVLARARRHPRVRVAGWVLLAVVTALALAAAGPLALQSLRASVRMESGPPPPASPRADQPGGDLLDEVVEDPLAPRGTPARKTPSSQAPGGQAPGGDIPAGASPTGTGSDPTGGAPTSQEQVPEPAVPPGGGP